MSEYSEMPNSVQRAIDASQDDAVELTAEHVHKIMDTFQRSQFIYAHEVKKGHGKLFELVRKNQEMFRQAVYMNGYRLYLNTDHKVTGIIPLDLPHMKRQRISKVETMLILCMRVCYEDQAMAGLTGPRHEATVPMDEFMEKYLDLYQEKFEWSSQVTELFKNFYRLGLIFSKPEGLQELDYQIQISPVIMQIAGDEYAKRLEHYATMISLDVEHEDDLNEIETRADDAALAEED